jgi:hypothetical protein
MKYVAHLSLNVDADSVADAVVKILNPAASKAMLEIISINVGKFEPFEGIPVTPSMAQSMAAEEAFLDAEPIPNEEEPVVQEVEEDEPCCQEEETSSLPLPKDVPYIGTLEKAGETLDSLILKAQAGDLTEIKGVAAGGAAKITQYLINTGRLKANDEPPAVSPEADEDEDPLGPPTKGPDIATTFEDVPAPTGPAPKKAGSVSASDVKKVLAQVAQAKKVPGLRKILGEFEAKNITDVKEEDYPAIHARALAFLHEED